MSITSILRNFMLSSDLQCDIKELQLHVHLEQQQKKAKHIMLLLLNW